MMVKLQYLAQHAPGLIQNQYFCYSISRSRRQFRVVEPGEVRYPGMHRRLFRARPAGGCIESDIFAQ